MIVILYLVTALALCVFILPSVLSVLKDARTNTVVVLDSESVELLAGLIGSLSVINFLLAIVLFVGSL